MTGADPGRRAASAPIRSAPACADTPICRASDWPTSRARQGPAGRLDNVSVARYGHREKEGRPLAHNRLNTDAAAPIFEDPATQS